MSPDPTQQDGAPDRVLEVRLDALLKNFQQIAKTKMEVEARVTEVKILHDIAKTHQMGIDYRLKDIGEDIATTRNRLEGLRTRLPPAAMERPIENLQRVASQVDDVCRDFHRMLAIIERMSEGWKQTADDRLKTLDTTLLHESGMRVTKIEELQRQLHTSAATRAFIWDKYEELAYREGNTMFG